MGLMTCPDCKNQISTNAAICPRCGNDYFYVATGEERQIECDKCNGVGIRHYKIESYGFYGECDFCRKSGRIKQKEAINCRNNNKEWLKV